LQEIYNTQTQTKKANTQKIENPNPNLDLWIFWVNMSDPIKPMKLNSCHQISTISAY